MEIPEIPDSVTTYIFDLDGTIIQSEPLHARALSNLLDKIGLRTSSEELVERFSGHPDDYVYYEIFNQNSHVTLNQFIREKTNILLSLLNTINVNELKDMLTPGIIEAIQYLFNNGKQVAVGSASELIIIQTILQRIGLSPYLPIVRGRTDTFRSKPNPGVYLSIMRQLKVSSDQVVIFEDSLPGVQAANLTGSYVIRIGDPDEDEDEYEQGPFSDFEDLAVVDNFSWLIDEDDESECQEDEQED